MGQAWKKKRDWGSYVLVQSLLLLDCLVCTWAASLRLHAILVTWDRARLPQFVHESGLGVLERLEAKILSVTRTVVWGILEGVL
jgi:hypothetical protein